MTNLHTDWIGCEARGLGLLVFLLYSFVIWQASPVISAHAGRRPWAATAYCDLLWGVSSIGHVSDLQQRNSLSRCQRVRKLCMRPLNIAVRRNGEPESASEKLERGREPDDGVLGKATVARPNFWQQLLERAGVLIALLIFQSCSSFILEDYEVFLMRHSVIVFFLTMLVGAGGNAGSQAAVLVVRGLATGEISAKNAVGYVLGEATMALVISLLMVLFGYARVVLFGDSQLDALAISCSLFCIVFSSVLIGSTLPLLLHRCHVDPAHAGATIQVIMDLMGACITCVICSIILEDEVPALPNGMNSSSNSTEQNILLVPTATQSLWARAVGLFRHVRDCDEADCNLAFEPDGA